MAQDSYYDNFRVKRLIIDGVRQKSIKTYKQDLILGSLTRLLIMESTQLVSDPRLTNELVQYDIRTQQSLSLNSLFCFSGMHVVTKDSFTFPAKTFFVFAHNAPITAAQLQSHPLVEHLKRVKSQDKLIELTALSQHHLMPKPKVIDYKTISSKVDIDVVEFQQSFYKTAFRDPTNRPSDLQPLTLRLCAFIDMKMER